MPSESVHKANYTFFLRISVFWHRNSHIATSHGPLSIFRSMQHGVRRRSSVMPATSCNSSHFVLRRACLGVGAYRLLYCLRSAFRGLYLHIGSQIFGREPMGTQQTCCSDVPKKKVLLGRVVATESCMCCKQMPASLFEKNNTFKKISMLEAVVALCLIPFLIDTSLKDSWTLVSLTLCPYADFRPCPEAHQFTLPEACRLAQLLQWLRSCHMTEDSKPRLRNKLDLQRTRCDELA